LRHQADCRRGASHLRSVFKSFGAQTTMLGLENPQWNPIILAKFKGNPSTAAKRKKILFYGHYDVIPAENEQGKWICDPFQMEGINDYLYGRGTSDNKGPIIAAIFAVAELVAQKALDSDIIFLIEGEEECGSRGFEQAVHANKHLIGDIDWILLANSYWLDDHVPCLTYGLRGVIHATVEVKSKHPDLHSGVDGSSLLDESLKDLVTLLSKLTGKNNHVEIPSFYDPILPLSKEEEGLYEEITRTLIDRNPGLGDPLELAETLQRRWREASLTIHRFYTSGPDNSTIIPSVAKAAISLRLVPEQTAQEVADALTLFLEDEFEKLGSKNQLTVAIDHKAEPWLGDYNNKIFQTLEEAVIEAWSDSTGTLAVESSRRRRSSASAAKLTSVSSHPLNGKANGRKPTKPSPTTSSTLATGSITPPLEESSDVEDILPSPPPGPSASSYFPSRQNSLPFSSKKRKPLYIREGGSIPAIRFLEKEFDAPAAHLPVGQASDSAHLDNERLRLTNLYKAKEVFGFVFRELPKR
jgi:di- and tripeptidase